ncbi:MAG: NAD-dependent dehydratase [Bdellovibrionaceae bacterium]|nr:NAD-dependent dehydratase [Pseudobdellovibrionaceae bacterium]|tara:strand:+ start:3488 stop:4462 length:975 start_codon:yes stop_codon:yes gene_type:complete
MSEIVLVTGGTGFLGSSLVKKLVNQGKRVRVIDNNFRGAPRKLLSVENEIEWVTADIRDLEKVKEACLDVSTIIHMAYINGTELFYKIPDKIIDVAVRGMLTVMDAGRSCGVSKFVLASSSEVYQTPALVPTPEEVSLIIPDILNPRYSYGGGKIVCELLAMHLATTYFEKTLIFRPHNVYGPDMGWEHVLPQFAMRAQDLMSESNAEMIDFQIQGDGKQTRAFIHIDDFTRGLIQVIEKGENKGIYHIGNPEELSILDVVEELGKVVKRKFNVVAGEEPKGATPRRCPDISKLKALGFEPEISFAQGLPSLVQWYFENRKLQK